MSDKSEEMKTKEDELEAIGKSKVDYNKLKEKLNLVLEKLKFAKKKLISAKGAFNKAIDGKLKKKKLVEIQNIIECIDKYINKIENIYIPEITREVSLEEKKINYKTTELENLKKKIQS